MRKNFSSKYIESLRPSSRTVEHWDTKVPSFGVRVSPSGLCTFILYVRWPGKNSPTRRKIGRANGHRAITLEQARIQAREWLASVELGVDPRVRDRSIAAEAARSAKVTFAVVAEDWFKEIAGRQRKAREVISDVRREFIARWGKMPITDVTTLDIVTVIRAKKDEGHSAQARNLLGHVKRLFDWAIEQHVYGIDESPAERIRGVKLIGKKVKRNRVLSDDETRAVWRASEQMGYPYGPVVRLLLMTGQRRSEIGAGRWREINFEKREWTVPAERMKMGLPHILPLTPQMIAVLRGLPRFTKGDYIFSTDFGVRPADGYSKAKERLDALTGPFERPYVLHDLRRTMRSHVEDPRLNIRERVAEAMIAHKPPGIIETYVVYRYLDEKRQAFEAWDRRLRAILLQQDYGTSNVVALHG